MSYGVEVERTGSRTEARQIKALSAAFRESIKAEVTEEIKAEIKEGLTWVQQNSSLEMWARGDSNPGNHRSQPPCEGGVC